MKIEKNEALYCLKSNTDKTCLSKKRTYAAKFLGVPRWKIACLIQPDPFKDRIFTESEIALIKFNYETKIQGHLVK